MDCPTCFQKITVPQAPAGEDQKLILTGTKVTEKPAAVTAPAPAPGSDGKFSGALVVVLILVFVGAAAAAVYWATIIRPRHVSGAAPTTNASPTIVSAQPLPAAPPASDANWMLTLNTNAIPDAPVSGRVHGQDFIVQHAGLQNGTLSLRCGGHGSELGVWINFSGAPAETLSGRTINITTHADKAAKITLRWHDADGTRTNESFEGGYAMRLEFGTLADNRIPGKIHLCLPDEQKSYVLGSFTAEVRKPKPKEPPKQ
jgi:hypothetical protein